MDVRFQKDIEAYAAWQVGNRQLNRELLEYGRMREYYQGREEEMPYKSLGTFRTARRSNNLSPAFKKWRNRRMDENTFKRWTQIKDFRNCPKTLDDLQEIKYNKNVDGWDLIKRERKTISDINGKNWSEGFRSKAIDTYYEFREHGIEFTDHGIARLLARMSKDTFLEIHKQPFNYRQSDGRLVKYYNDQAVIYLPDTLEVVSVVVNRKKPKEDWDAIKN